MSAHIVDFKGAKLRIAIRKFEETGTITEYLLKDDMYKKTVGLPSHKVIEKIIQEYKIQNYINLQTSFIQEFRILEGTLKTNSNKFMFPTVLCNYRRGINPVHALYYSLQEALFKYNISNTKFVWLVSLFENKIWLDELLIAIHTDIKNINTFIKKYNSHKESPYITAKLKDLQDKKKNLIHYAEVFVLVEEWKKNN